GRADPPLPGRLPGRAVEARAFRATRPRWSAEELATCRIVAGAAVSDQAVSAGSCPGKTAVRNGAASCQRYGMPDCSASSKTAGELMNTACSRVIAKSCMSDGPAPLITVLRTSSPAASATWYTRYGANGL